MSDSNAVSTLSSSKLRGIIRGIKFMFISYIVSALLIAVLAALLTYTDVPESVASPAVWGITLFAAFLSAFYTAKSASVRGWLCGMVSGVCNVLVLAGAGMIIYSAPVSASMLLRIAGGAVAGAIGGICGINSKR
ncbi:MAG: TIGR04086 family membrane protein [Clostridia bacterium]|nr:TIGR04086 family membrane protein [Clostridia bacterium]